ncbi:hypothetical protein B7767_21525 [Streptomyces sp. 13-12-16]|nr:hypothetical protein B7767_21525 [Streptomyces sp. 13-12-16]
MPERFGNRNTIYKNFDRFHDRARPSARRGPATGHRGEAELRGAR